MNKDNIYEKVYAKERMPKAAHWYDTNKGNAYFDGTDFYASGICVNSITQDIAWWLEKIAPERISITGELF